MNELSNGVEELVAAIGVMIIIMLILFVGLIGYIIVSISYMGIMDCLGMPKGYAWVPFYRKYLAGDYAARITEPTFGALTPYIKWCWCLSGIVSSVPVIGSIVSFVAGIFNYVVKIVSVYKSQGDSVGLAILTFFFPAFWGFIVAKKDVK